MANVTNMTSTPRPSCSQDLVTLERGSDLSRSSEGEGILEVLAYGNPLEVLALTQKQKTHSDNETVANRMLLLIHHNIQLPSTPVTSC